MQLLLRPGSPVFQCFRRGLLTVAAGLALAGCGGGSSVDSGNPDGDCDPSAEYCGTVPISAAACTDTIYWPLSLRSATRPLIVHYSRLSDEAKAAETLAILENAWTVQVDQLGFSPPLDDGGACGPDGSYDVFLWRSVDGAYVDAIANNPQTPHDDYSTYMAIDAFGVYGGEFLDTTLAHEFNHSVQASDDWWESPLIFEMTATFAEALVHPDQDDWFYTMEDFQARPNWSLFYDDAYQTWYMYGAAMFLHFLREQYFPQDSGFIARAWLAMRSEPPADRPDFIDALRSILLDERGVALDAAIVGFMQWRWFTGEFDDGNHFARGTEWPHPVAILQADAADASIVIDVRAMHYGAEFLRVTNDDSAERVFDVVLQNDDMAVSWRLTTVEGDDTASVLTVPAQSSRVLVAVALPSVPVSATTVSFDDHTARLTLTAR